jgi:hypothetical protein
MGEKVVEASTHEYRRNRRLHTHLIVNPDPLGVAKVVELDSVAVLACGFDQVLNVLGILSQCRDGSEEVAITQSALVDIVRLDSTLVELVAVLYRHALPVAALDLHPKFAIALEVFVRPLLLSVIMRGLGAGIRDGTCLVVALAMIRLHTHG